MIFELDARRRLEIAAFRLAYTCERCVAFEVDRGGCSLGYPNDEHREGAAEASGRLTFCKEFELA